ncbi:hypothetical protein DV735_g3724, partial [Chaetothyriales sp. CBS 134920]
MSSKSQSPLLEAARDGDAVADNKPSNEEPSNEPSNKEPSKPLVSHYRTNTHGTYLLGLSDDFEHLERYEKDGYHPVYIGDILGPPAAQYRVIHKLGYGGFGTLAHIDMNEEELLSCIGEPYKAYVETESGEDIPAFQPKYLTAPAEMELLGTKYLTDQICVIDFGQCHPISSPPPGLGIPQHYQPIEVLLEVEYPIGLASDLWALGCTLHEIRQQMPLFYMIPEKDELIGEIFSLFGKPPQILWDKWTQEARQKYFDDQVRWHGSCGAYSIEKLLSIPLERLGAGPEEITLPEAELVMMADILRKLLHYDPEKRISTEEVLRHEWFKMVDDSPSDRVEDAASS